MSVEKTSASQLRVANVGYCVFESALAESIVQAGGSDALGVWVYLINKPSGWKIVPTDVQKRCGLGRDRYTRAVAVLKGVGVLRQIRQMAGGRFTGSELVVSNAILAPDKPIKPEEAPSLQKSVASKEVASKSPSRQVSGASGNPEPPENPSTPENNPLSNLLSNKQLTEVGAAEAAAPSGGMLWIKKFPAPSGFDEELWGRYLAGRAEASKHPMDAESLRFTAREIHNAVTAGWSSSAVLETMIKCGWRGVKAQWLEREQVPKKSAQAATAPQRKAKPATAQQLADAEQAVSFAASYVDALPAAAELLGKDERARLGDYASMASAIAATTPDVPVALLLKWFELRKVTGGEVTLQLDRLLAVCAATGQSFSAVLHYSMLRIEVDKLRVPSWCPAGSRAGGVV